MKSAFLLCFATLLLILNGCGGESKPNNEDEIKSSVMYPNSLLPLRNGNLWTYKINNHKDPTYEYTLIAYLDDDPYLQKDENKSHPLYILWGNSPMIPLFFSINYFYRNHDTVEYISFHNYKKKAFFYPYSASYVDSYDYKVEDPYKFVGHGRNIQTEFKLWKQTYIFVSESKTLHEEVHFVKGIGVVYYKATRKSDSSIYTEFWLIDATLK
ncbi:MAG: hypothetical protein KGZ71_01965 [Desulfobulbaceae bacterium]|nr:hypothetical protein [Candidatus Kapabacteria bacterium]MBS3999229.1 hypothetical protein [Desulfobulbaceae bacterium]